MKLRQYDPEKDFNTLKTWIADERTHAMWSANRFKFPLDRDNLSAVLAEGQRTNNDTPLVATDDTDTAQGFFVFAYNEATREAMLKFIVVDPECRGKGIAREMLKLATEKAFSNPDAQAVNLNVFPNNERAKRCYEKVGFRERETTPKAFPYKDELWDRCNMVIGRED